jgi:hypothetical protein
MSNPDRPKRKKPRVGGAAMAIGLIFSAVFDPAKKAAVEQLDRQKCLPKGDEAAGR